MQDKVEMGLFPINFTHREAASESPVVTILLNFRNTFETYIFFYK